MPTMLDSLDEHKHVDAVMDALHRARRALGEAVSLLVAEGATFAERELAALELANEACRLNLEDELQAVADAQTSEGMLIDGVAFRRHHEGSATYHSLCGAVRIRRPTYRDLRVRNGPTVVPLDLQLGIIEGATPALAYRIALGYAQCPSRQLEKQLAASQRVAPSRSTLERIAKAIGTQAKTHQVELEPIVRSQQPVAAHAGAISIGLDRTTIPMEELCPFEQPLHRQKTRSKPYVRRRPEPVHVQYRMAYVGTVSIVDSNADAICVYRYASSAEEGPSRVVASMMADVRHTLERRARSRKPPLPVGIVQDAAPEMWQLLTTALRAEAIVPTWHEAVDRFHLMEHLAGALSVLPLAQHTKTQTLTQWRSELSRSDTAIDNIERFLHREEARYAKTCAAANRRFRFNDWTILRDHIKYIRNHKHRMRYATHHQLGLPTGSGATEGACKSLVTMRTKGSGQRWHGKGVDAVLTLRAYEMSGRLPAFFRCLAETYTAATVKPGYWASAA